MIQGTPRLALLAGGALGLGLIAAGCVRDGDEGRPPKPSNGPGEGSGSGTGKRPDSSGNPHSPQRPGQPPGPGRPGPGAPTGSEGGAGPHRPTKPVKPLPPRFQHLRYGIVNGSFEGFGTQFSTHAFDLAGRHAGITPAKRPQLERRARQLQARHVRIFVPQEVIKDLSSIRRPKVRREMQARADGFYRAVDLARQSGGTVNLTWPGGLSTSPRQEWVIAGLVDVVAELRTKWRNESLRGAKLPKIFITLDNEPSNGGQLHIPAKRKARVAGYVRAYKLLDAELRQRGLRQDVRVIAQDTYREKRADWFSWTGKPLQDVVDGWSFHVYWRMGERQLGVTELKRIRQLVQKHGPGKPIYINEFGTEGRNAAVTGPRLRQAALEEAWFGVNAARSGVDAIVKWDAYYAGLTGPKMHKMGYRARYGDPGKFYMVTGPRTDFRVRPAYNVQRMFNRSVLPGTRAMAIPTEHSKVKAVGFRSADKHHFTALAVNLQAKDGVLELKRMPRSVALYLTTWNEKDDGRLRAPVRVRPNRRGELQVAVPGKGAIALSSADPTRSPRPLG